MYDAIYTSARCDSNINPEYIADNGASAQVGDDSIRSTLDRISGSNKIRIKIEKGLICVKDSEDSILIMLNYWAADTKYIF